MSHPYSDKPAYTRWSRSVAGVDAGAVDPVVDFPWRITTTDRIVTAGSCFAQHIARRLGESGYNHHIVEPGHPAIPPAIRTAHNYGLYSARYGNVYTSRQLLQLFKRALRQFKPKESVWRRGDAFIDPYRPIIEPDGFSSLEELKIDRWQHLKAVRQAMMQLDVFVFTLGLTETWISRIDGAAFPLCPGVEGGAFDPDVHAFVNLEVADVVAEMTEALAILREVNPKAKVILTVSPVPLAATALDRHVLTSTIYSKSVLRVAADMVARTVPDVTYFPSYEIITGPHADYFAPDLRSVTDRGVDHVMRLFFEHATEGGGAEPPPPTPAKATSKREQALDTVTEAMCEEALLDR